jgi:hypothetical protein
LADNFINGRDHIEHAPAAAGAVARKQVDGPHILSLTFPNLEQGVSKKVESERIAAKEFLPVKTVNQGADKDPHQDAAQEYPQQKFRSTSSR